MQTRRVLRIGVLGLGVIAGYYLPALAASPDVRVTAVCDRRPDRASAVPAGAWFTDDYRAVLAADDVDAVVVNLPNDLHHESCRSALLAGKHVCCEKPLTVRPDDAAELADVAAATGTTLFTSFHRRYNANLVRLRARLAAGPPPCAVAVSYRERIEEHCGDDAWYLDPGRCGGGCLMDNGPNALDIVLSLLGDVTVAACDIEWDGHGVDRRAGIRLAAADGRTAAVTLDWAYPDGEDKAVTVAWADGRRATVDMLAGFTGFKSSLYHEYEGVVADFAHTVAHPTAGPDTGVRVARLVADAYRLGGRYGRKTA